MITEEQLRVVKQQAVKDSPNEAVWLVTAAGVKKVKNVHDEPEKYFAVAARDHALALKAGLLGVIHSHPGGVAAPSEADMASQIASAVPWGVLEVTDGVASDITWWGTQAADKAPLIGRSFCHGVTDCYALIKDYYLLERGVTLPEFPRDWEWWQHGANWFTEGFSVAGFVRIDQSEATTGDVWLAQLRSDVPNHGGVLYSPDTILHQPGSKNPVDPFKLSVREPVHRYANLITHWLRYVGDKP